MPHLLPSDYFSNQYNVFSDKLSVVVTKIRSTSFLRLSVFLISVIGIYLTIANGYEWFAIPFIAGIGIFIYLVRLHLKLEKEKTWYEANMKINDVEKKLLNGKTDNIDSGTEFIVTDHPFADDLDVFGRKSLFQLINRTATFQGKERLARLLSDPLFDISLIKSRQEAISEVSGIPEWRQAFQATGLLFNEEKNDQPNLVSWSASKTHKFNTFFYRFMLILNPVVGFSIIALIELNVLTISAFILYLAIPFILIGPKLTKLTKIHSDVSKKSDLLTKYTKLFQLIGNRDFNSDLLINIKNQIVGEENAEEAVRKLASITKSMDYRLNMLMGIILNIFFLWDIRQAIRIEKWKSKYAKSMENWFNQLSTVDELQSFAGFAFVNHSSVFPDFSHDDFYLSGENVKHPFIRSEVSVGNVVEFNGWKQYHVITGANMAGKSTYLRTIGVNILLAMTGSVVLADRFVVTPVSLFTGIKTTDSLQDGESYFFAELKRLKEIITRLESGQRLFIILDEVLRGTNSADKRKGSMALISQLITLGASGMIATHDLELGKLNNEFPDNITNMRFEVEIINDELVFDYKLKDGISQNLNATFLMKKMGITL